MEDATTCMVCLSIYGRKDAEPLVLRCGHTVCRGCVTTLVKTGPHCCPKCKKEHTFQSLKTLPVNYDLLAVVEEYTLTKKNICNSHEEQMKYWCRECQRPLCGRCLLHGHLEHGHEVITAEIAIYEQKNDLRKRANHLQEVYSKDKSTTTNKFLDAINSVIQLCGRSDTLVELNKGVDDTFSSFLNSSNFEVMSSSKNQLRTLEAEVRAKGLFLEAMSESSDPAVSSASQIAPDEGPSGSTSQEGPTASSSHKGLITSSQGVATTSPDHEASIVSSSEQVASSSQEAANSSQETTASTDREEATAGQGKSSTGNESASANQEAASANQKATSAYQEAASANQEAASAGPELASANQEAASANQEAAAGSPEEEAKLSTNEIGNLSEEEETADEAERVWPLTCCVLVQEAQQATLSWEHGKVLLAAPRDVTMDPLIMIKLPVIEDLIDKENPEVFLELGAPFCTLGRVHIRLQGRTRLAQQFLALCIGKLGPSFLGSKMLRVDNEDAEEELLVGGQYRHPNAHTNKFVSKRLMAIKKFEYSKPIIQLKEALVVGCGGGCPSEETLFGICTRSGIEETRENPVLGRVVSGMEVVRSAVSHNPVSEVFITNCGLVM